MTHELKCWPVYFQEIITGRKEFELRYNDRNFKLGDLLILKEYEFCYHRYTKRECTVKVTYLLNDCEFGLLPNYSLMSIKLI